MDELGDVWLGPQSEDDLKHKILLATFELETVRMEVSKIKHQSETNQKQLHAMLQSAFEERDEAKQQLQQLLDTFMLASSTPVVTQFPTLKEINRSEMITPLTKPHSGITDHQSNNKVETFFDTVSSEKSCKYMGESSRQYDDDYDDDDDELNSYILSPVMLGAGQSMVDPDHASNVIDQLVTGKVLPCKGRLLEAVMKAGPNLQAMMLLSGPLPQWKNPPPVIQPLGFQPGMMINNVHAAANQRVLRPSLSTSIHEPSLPNICASPHIDDRANVFDLSGGSACLNKNQWMIDVGNNKRPRMVWQ